MGTPLRTPYEVAIETLYSITREALPTNENSGLTIATTPGQTDALILLAKEDRFIILDMTSTKTTGYWPDNLPKKGT